MQTPELPTAGRGRPDLGDAVAGPMADHRDIAGQAEAPDDIAAVPDAVVVPVDVELTDSLAGSRTAEDADFDHSVALEIAGYGHVAGQAEE